MSADPAVQLIRSCEAEGDLECFEILLRSNYFPLLVRTPRPLSDDELLEFCAVHDSLRIERTPAGELMVMTPAGGKTSNREGYLCRELDLWAERAGRGVAFNANGGFSLPDGSVRAADAAWLSSERWESLTNEEQSKFPPFCPEFVVELRSPSDSVSELEAKMSAWMGNGAQLGWLIDPERKLAVIYRPGQEPETVHHPDTLYGEGLLAGFELKMQRLWE